MPVYVLREGRSNIFKIGTTEADPERRRRKLNCGSSAGLQLFQVVNLEPARDAEALFHRLLAHRRVGGDGGTEFFELQSENHMRVFLEHAIALFQRQRAVLPDLAACGRIESSTKMLPPETEDYAVLDALGEVRRRLRELEDEAAFLRVEAEILEGTLQVRVGGELGIEGVAIWETKSSSPRFCATKFIASEPELHLDLLQRFQKLDLNTWRRREPSLYGEITSRFPVLDTTAWRNQPHGSADRRLYDRMRSAYFTSAVSRRFVLLDR